MCQDNIPYKIQGERWLYFSFAKITRVDMKVILLENDAEIFEDLFFVRFETGIKGTALLVGTIGKIFVGGIYISRTALFIVTN